MPSKYGTDSTKSFYFSPELPKSLATKVAGTRRRPGRSQRFTRRERLFSNTLYLHRRSSMTNPVVLITGALTGIGRATALAFAQEGARIVVSGRRDQEGQALTQELRDRGVEAEFVLADVRHEDDVRNLVDKTVARFGRLDVAVNNAGTQGKAGPGTEQTPESYSATFDTNVLGVLLSMKHEMRVMKAQGSGSIVNLSSTMGPPGPSPTPVSRHQAPLPAI